MDTDEGQWTGWNWRTEGDMMVNGAFFVPSGAGLSTQYAKASSVEPKSAALIDQLTSTAGVFGDPRSPLNYIYTLFFNNNKKNYIYVYILHSSLLLVATIVQTTIKS